jgi:poly-gamma-glutamate synthesis protein (capsule biosynthesis protein)
MYKVDYKIINLETPIFDENNPSLKSELNLKALIFTINGIKRLNQFLKTMANDHFMDDGIKGSKSTFKLLKDNPINYIYASCNLKNIPRT